MKAKLYPNEMVKRVVAFVPPGHWHARFVIELCDQVLVLHEAAVAAITRAYVDITTHPRKRAVELVAVKLGRDGKKPGYAEWQLVESGRSEDEVLRDALAVISESEVAECFKEDVARR